MLDQASFQGYLGVIRGNRQSYNSGFRGGTQTLDRDKLDEDVRQFDLSLEDTKQARKESALQAALDRQEKSRQFGLSHDLARMETEYNINKPYYNPTTGSTKAASDNATNNALADAYESIDTALASGVDVDALKKNIYSYEPDFARSGIKMADVILYLDNKVADQSGAPRMTGDPVSDMQSKQQYEKEQQLLEKQRLKARPFLQKAVDILPGKQFR